LLAFLVSIKAADYGNWPRKKSGTVVPRYLLQFFGTCYADSKAMRSMNIIKYLIKNQVGTDFSSDYDTIISVHLNIAKMDLFRVLRNKTKLIAKKIIFLALGSDKNTHFKAFLALNLKSFFALNLIKNALN